MTWSRNCVISEISRTAAVAANPPNPAGGKTKINSAIFHVFSANLYVPVVTLSINDNCKFLKNKARFKRTNFWDRYRSKITTQHKNNNLDCIIDPSFRNINTLFVLSFKNGDIDPKRDSFDMYYMPLFKIKDFNALIENKTFFGQPVRKQTRSKPMKNLLKFQEMMTIQQETY